LVQCCSGIIGGVTVGMLAAKRVRVIVFQTNTSIYIKPEHHAASYLVIYLYCTIMPADKQGLALEHKTVKPLE
jgi:hypothetical protein